MAGKDALFHLGSFIYPADGHQQWDLRVSTTQVMRAFLQCYNKHQTDHTTANCNSWYAVLGLGDVAE